jgi:hypothetical protein
MMVLPHITVGGRWCVYFKIHTRKLSCFRAVDQIETFDHDFIIQGDRVRMDNVVYYPPTERC